MAWGFITNLPTNQSLDWLSRRLLAMVSLFAFMILNALFAEYPSHLFVPFPKWSGLEHNRWGILAQQVHYKLYILTLIVHHIFIRVVCKYMLSGKTMHLADNSIKRPSVWRLAIKHRFIFRSISVGFDYSTAHGKSKHWSRSDELVMKIRCVSSHLYCSEILIR